MATLGRALLVLAVLLDSVLRETTHDGTTDCSEEAVVHLVATVATGDTTGESTHETTLTLLGLTGGTLLLGVLLLVVVAVIR